MVPSSLLRIAHRILHWAPLWVPMILLWQVAFRGLRPALAERARLRQAEVVVRERYRRTKERFEGMQAEARAWTDPVFQERMRRQIRAARTRPDDPHER